MKRLAVLLVGAALVLLSSVAASDCEDIIATDVSLGDDVLVKNGAIVTDTKEDRAEVVTYLIADDKDSFLLMVAEGRAWTIQGDCDDCGAKAVTVELDGGFLDSGLWRVYFASIDRYGWVPYDDVVLNE